MLYAKHCQECHGDRIGVGKHAQAPYHGPSGHTWLHADSVLERIILEGLGPREEGTGGEGDVRLGMPARRDALSLEEIRDVLDYLKTWWTPQVCEVRVEMFGAAEGSC